MSSNVRVLVVVALAVAGCGSRSALRMGGVVRADAAAGGEGGPPIVGGGDGGMAVRDGGVVVRDGGMAEVRTPGVLALDVSPALASAGIRTTVSFTATALYADGSTRDVTAMAIWTSTAPAVASVAAGLARTLTAGTTTIRATLTGVSDDATLTVTAAALTAITVDPTQVTVPAGGRATVQVTGLFADGSKQDLTGQVTWAALDAAVATVAGGVVTGVRAGMTRVTASFQGMTAAVAVTVTSAAVTSLEIAPANPTLPLPGMQPFTATALYDDGSKGDVSSSVTWESSDEAVLEISAQGLGVTHAAGTSIVIARLGMVTATSTVTVTGAKLTAIQVAPGAATLPRGTSQAFTATASYADGRTADATTSVVWSTDPTAIAAASNAPGSQGLVTALAPGGTVVTAALDGVTGAAKLLVVDAVVTGLAVTPTTLAVPAGARAPLSATATFSDGSKRDVTALASWASSDPAVAGVSSAAATAGDVSGLQPGSTDVTATYSGKSASAHVTVSAAVLTGIAVSPPMVALVAGLKQSLTATATFSDGSSLDVTARAIWSSDDPMIATVSNTAAIAGQVTAVAAGTTSVHARLGGKDGAAAVTVTASTLERLSVDPQLPVRQVGQNVQFGATALASNGTGRNVTAMTGWTSSDPAVATIVAAGAGRGRATCVAAGKTIVTATFMGLTDTSILTCNVATLTSLEVTPVLTSLQVGRTQPFVATALFSDGTSRNVTGQATWTSSNPGVARVSNMGNRGLVTAIAAGSSQITATFMGLTASGQLSVSPAVLTALSVSPVLVALRVAQSRQLAATAIFSDGSTRDVTGMATWSSASPMVAAVSNRGGARGQVTGRAPGSSAVSASFMGLSDSAMVEVSAPKLTGLSVSPIGVTLTVGQQQAFQATALFDDGSSQNVSGQAVWKSSDPTVADVASGPAGGRGVVAGLGKGTATITATYMGVADAVTVAVSDGVLKELQVTPVGTTLPRGLSQPFQAVGIFSDGTSRTVTDQASWTSSAPAVADVANGAGMRGLVTTLGPGSAQITAALGGVTGSAALTVTAATVTMLQVTPPNPTLPGGLTQPFQAVAVYSDNTSQNVTTVVTWSTSDEEVAAVSNAAGSRGLVTTLLPGSALIAASFMGVTGSSVLTVTSATLTGIAVTPGSATIPRGATLPLVATGKLSDGSMVALTELCTWVSSAQTTVVAVSNVADARGLATAVGPGTASIEAHFQGQTGTATITVNP